MTGPTRRPWKSFRTSSQLCTPSLRIDPTRASRRRQREPTRQVCASILGVPVTPSLAVEPTLPARPALQALEKARRCDPAAGGSPAALGPRLHLLLRCPETDRGVLGQSAAGSPSPAGARWRGASEDNGRSRTESASIRLWPSPRAALPAANLRLARGSRSADRPRPVAKPRPRATPRAAPARLLSRDPRGPGWRKPRAALPGGNPTYLSPSIPGTSSLMKRRAQRRQDMRNTN